MREAWLKTTLQCSPLLLATIATMVARDNGLYPLAADFLFDTPSYRCTVACSTTARHFFTSMLNDYEAV